MSRLPASSVELPSPTLPELRERDRVMDSLRLLAGKLAHDFNNFLAPILGYVTLIKEEAPAGANIGDYLNSMEASSRRTEKLIETILLAARPQRQFHPKVVELHTLIAAEVNEWQSALHETAQVEVRKNLSPCSVVADAPLLRHVFAQLLSNARFALATGGTVEITLAPETIDVARARELGLASQNLLRLEVVDTGFGMSDEVKTRAFELFFTTRPKGQALGLGLSIVHSVMRLHGGQVMLESTPEQGTRVILWFPIPGSPGAPEPEDGTRTLARSVSQPKARSRKVLLVDDDPMVREVIKACLQHAHFEVHTAEDGVQGLKLYQRHAKDLGLIITDVTMPQMNGVEMLLEIYKTTRDIPVLLISGEVEAKVQPTLAALGEQTPRLLRKPFALKTLLKEVKAVTG